MERQTDARKLDHTTLEEMRIRACAANRLEESPEALCAAIHAGSTAVRYMAGWRSIGEVAGER